MRDSPRPSRTLLIVGAGDIARRAVPWLQKRFRIHALTRSEQTARRMRALGVCPVRGDLDDFRSLERLAGLADVVLHLAPPPATGDTDPRTLRLLTALARGRFPQRIVYVGTTGVYGDRMGTIVNETAPCLARHPRARRRRNAEQLLRRFNLGPSRCVTLLRAGGLYAQDRLPLDRLRRGDPVLAEGDDVLSQFMHADDLARLCGIALFLGRSGRLVNAVDDVAIKFGDFFDYAADAAGLPRPPRMSRVQLEQRLSPQMMYFMTESRRIDNRRMVDELRFRLRYPSVQVALAKRRG